MEIQFLPPCQLTKTRPTAFPSEEDWVDAVRCRAHDRITSDLPLVATAELTRVIGWRPLAEFLSQHPVVETFGRGRCRGGVILRLNYVRVQGLSARCRKTAARDVNLGIPSRKRLFRIHNSK